MDLKLKRIVVEIKVEFIVLIFYIQRRKEPFMNAILNFLKASVSFLIIAISFVALSALLITNGMGIIGCILYLFIIINRHHREWIKYYGGFDTGKCRLARWEKVILFPGLANSFYKKDIIFQRCFVLSTVIALLLIFFVFNVVLQLITLVVYAIIFVLFGIPFISN